jgi:hypothetical protein
MLALNVVLAFLACACAAATSSGRASGLGALRLNPLFFGLNNGEHETMEASLSDPQFQAAMAAQSLGTVRCCPTAPQRPYLLAPTGHPASHAHPSSPAPRATQPLMPTTLPPGWQYRYPAGTAGNYWDWEKGCQQGDSCTVDNKLPAYKAMVDAAGVAPLFVVNMLTSTLADQLACLAAAAAAGGGRPSPSPVPAGGVTHGRCCACTQPPAPLPPPPTFQACPLSASRWGMSSMTTTMTVRA